MLLSALQEVDRPNPVGWGEQQQAAPEARIYGTFGGTYGKSGHTGNKGWWFICQRRQMRGKLLDYNHLADTAYSFISVF